MSRPHTWPTRTPRSAALAAGSCCNYFPFRRSAHRFFIISDIRARASGDIVPRRRLRLGLTFSSPVSAFAAAPRGALIPARARSFAACAVSDASRSRVWLISRSRPPIAQPINSADFINVSFGSFRGRPGGIPSSSSRRRPVGKCRRQPNGYHSPMNRAWPTGTVILLVAALATPAPVHAAAPQTNPAAAALCDEALGLAYNLDHAEALARLRRAVALAPDDSGTHRALASVLWLNILFQRGAVTVDHYLGAFSGSTVNLAKPPPEIDAEFRSHVARAVALAEAQVKANGDDAQAHYDLGSALGLQASYVATVEGRMLAGVRAARQSYNEHERVLALDPSRKEAGLIVGTYRYLISTLTLPVRVMAYVAGFGGGRERGIQLIEGAARDTRVTGGTRHDARTEAMFALVLVYN